MGSKVINVRSKINKFVSQNYCDVLALLAYDLIDFDFYYIFANKI